MRTDDERWDSEHASVQEIAKKSLQLLYTLKKTSQFGLKRFLMKASFHLCYAQHFRVVAP